jgi:hypothetical protein
VHNRLHGPWETIRKVLNEVLWRLLQPHTFKHNPCAESKYCNILCTDGIFRHCTPDLAACCYAFGVTGILLGSYRITR